MPYTSQPKPVSYAEAVRAFNGQDVQDDLNDACGKLAHSMSAMMDKFEAITKQMQTIDLLRLSAPLRPRWDSMRKVSVCDPVSDSRELCRGLMGLL